jgi:hypothetical protein
MTKLIVAFRNLRTRLKKESEVIFYGKEICFGGRGEGKESCVTFSTIVNTADCIM